MAPLARPRFSVSSTALSRCSPRLTHAARVGPPPASNPCRPRMRRTHHSRPPGAARRRRLTRAVAPALLVLAAGLVAAASAGWWWAAVVGAVLALAGIPLGLGRYASLGHAAGPRSFAVRSGWLVREHA